MHIVNFNNAEKLQITLVEVLIKRVSCAYLKETVKVALIYKSECFVCYPFKPRGDNFDWDLAHFIIPDSVDKVLREIIVDKLSLCISNQKVLLIVIEI